MSKYEEAVSALVFAQLNGWFFSLSKSTIILTRSDKPKEYNMIYFQSGIKIKIPHDIGINVLASAYRKSITAQAAMQIVELNASHIVAVHTERPNPLRP